MISVLLLYPTQLFISINHIKEKNIILIEEPIYFTKYNFHKLKLAYTRTCMKKYYDFLSNKKFNITYIDFNKVNDNFYKNIKQRYDKINIISVHDHELETKLKNIFKIKLNILDNINFLISIYEIYDIKKLIFKNNNYNHSNFYKYMRKKYNILITKDNKYVGNKLSFDTENRKKMPDNFNYKDVNRTINKIDKIYINESINYINKHFNTNPGYLNQDSIIYPTDNKKSKIWFNDFLENKLNNFGLYQDYIDKDNSFLLHSVITPMLNLGLITDIEILNMTNDYYNKNKNKIKIQNYEGFIRQLIGWRNYMYCIYMLEPDLINGNLLKNSNKMPNKFWNNVGMKPIDILINRINKYSYLHHIERLMLLSVFMNMCFIHPKEILKYFMEWSIDGYDYIMVTNLWLMGLYSSEKVTALKRPYIASSNYIINMSNIKKDGKWEIIWDSLYYNFIDKHYNILKKNYFTSRQVRHYDNKTNKQKQEYKDIAIEYLNKLFI